MKRLSPPLCALLFSFELGRLSSLAGEPESVADEGGRPQSAEHFSITNDNSVYLSLGGELRERIEYYDEPLFGLRDLGRDSYLLHRLLLNADFHAGDNFRAFLQLGSHLEGGKEAQRSPTDVNEFDIQQAFVDLTLPLSARTKVTLR